MGSIFVYEYLSAGGPIEADAAELADLLAQGTAMRDAVADDLSRLSAWRVARAPRSDAAPAQVLQQAAREHRWLWAIAPESDGILLALAQAVPAAQWLGCSVEAIRIASSKRATLARLAAHGIATPLDFEAAATCWVVKPDDGAGAVHTRVLASRAQALAAARPGDVTEPWVEGEALSICLLAGTHPRALTFNRQRIDVDGTGAVSFHGVDVGAVASGDARAAALQRTALAVAHALPGLGGIVGIDCVWHAGRGPVVIEVNPRTTSAYVGLSRALGRNAAADVLASFGLLPEGT